MNKKSQYALVGMMMGIIVVIMAFQFIAPIKDQVVIARNATNLDCTNTSTDISTGQKMSCIAVDLYLPTLLVVFLGAAIGYVVGKKIQYTFSPPQQ